MSRPATGAGLLRLPRLPRVWPCDTVRGAVRGACVETSPSAPSLLPHPLQLHHHQHTQSRLLLAFSFLAHFSCHIEILSDGLSKPSLEPFKGILAARKHLRRTPRFCLLQRSPTNLISERPSIVQVASSFFFSDDQERLQASYIDLKNLPSCLQL